MIAASTNACLPNPGVLIASSDAGLRQRVIQELPTTWRPVEEALGGADALGKLEASECRMLLLDRGLPDLNVDELTSMVRLRYPGVEIRTFGGDRGAHWETSPAWQSEKAASPVNAGALDNMVGSSPAMMAVYGAVRKVASRDTAVLITGETGTGKELVAQAVHRLSPRASKPLVVINCAAIPETLLESELFGYVRGAFTGAAQSRLGRIQSAQGGTLFLDEIGEMPIALQAKLLRFLESGELQRLGSTETWKADVRIVTATNRNLRQAGNSNFRDDLYFRLAVFPIALPALRDRKEDIVPLAEHFLEKFSPGARLGEAGKEKLEGHRWPGNVRELRHVIERATILASAIEITADDLVLGSSGGD